MKAAVGYDPITDEDLTDQERDMLVLNGCIQTALLGVGVGASLAEKAAAKAATIEGKVIAGEEVSISGEAVAGEDVLIIGEGAAAEGGNATGLLDELVNSEVKYNIDDLVAITKTAEGKLVWLEKGTETAGLEHIITEHGIDYANIGIA
jgi:hypothetical protein